MTNTPTYPFPDDLKSELIEEIDDMGADYATGTLDAILLEANGTLVSHGVTKDMYEGQVISALTAADMIAVSLGQKPTLLDADLLDAISGHAADLQDTEGAADLAERALVIITDPDNDNFADCTADLPTRDDLIALVTPLLDTLGAAKAQYPGEWSDAVLGAGTFDITMGDDDD
ncbi:hypothetical protein [Roseobacter sp. CCS2]|uniref:hypothetical protein n=1 Tax=Roseobacter sp. CCS2 TaxID=391593 RepID=UPI0000F405A4|nr:hypothetical protein [Roseobacter sp. CCS2]EBA11476.1 hypothetical protein RCCS2_02418 [Roseobacter sp. CCS2]